MSVSTVFWKSVLLSQNHLLPTKNIMCLFFSFSNLNKSNIVMVDFMHRRVFQLGTEFCFLQKLAWFFLHLVWNINYAAMQFIIWERTVTSGLGVRSSGCILSSDDDLACLYLYHFTFSCLNFPLNEMRLIPLRKTFEAWYLTKLNKRCNTEAVQSDESDFVKMQLFTLLYVTLYVTRKSRKKLRNIFYQSNSIMDSSTGYMKTEKSVEAQQTNRKSVKGKNSTRTIALPLMKLKHPFV